MMEALKIGSAYSTPLSLNLEGRGFFFLCFPHNSLMNILQEIFTDYYEEIKYTLHPRSTEMRNIDKMIHCGDSSHGGAMYGCPHCGKLKFVPFRCHSQFCPSCGNKYSMERTFSMVCKLINVQHRHCVFTIDEDLRVFFSMTAPSLTACFMLLPVLFPECFLISINPETSLLVLSWFCIPLEEISSGILISIVLFLKAVTAMMAFGATSTISTTISCVMLSALPFLMKWNLNLVLLSRK